MGSASDQPTGKRPFEPVTTVADDRAYYSYSQSAKVSAELLRLLDAPRRDRDVGTFRGWPIVRIVGTGGMATVLQGYDERLRRDVAIKIVRPDRQSDPSIIDRFAREAHLTAQVRHPNVVVVYSVHDEANPPYLVMEFLSGGTLHDRLRDGPLPEAECIRLGREIAGGLQAAHNLGLLHRDLKPSNIGFREPYGQIVLTDFGLARAICDTDPITEHGSPVGTPSYMSPEQVQVQKLDVRSDLFSLGTVLYQMATGGLPFQGDAPVTTCHAIVHCPHQPARLVRPELSAGFSAVIDRLLQKNPEHRYRSANEVIQALDGLSAPSRRRSNLVVMIALVAALLGGGVWFWLNHRQPRFERRAMTTAQVGAPSATSRDPGTTVPGPPKAHDAAPAEVVPPLPWRTPPGEGRKGLITAVGDDAYQLENPSPKLDWVNMESNLDFRPGQDRFLLFEVLAVEGEDAGWNAKLAPRPGESRDIELSGGSGPGRFAIELPADVAGSSQTSLAVRLFTRGGAGARVQFRGVKFADSPPADYERLTPVQ